MAKRLMYKDGNLALYMTTPDIDPQAAKATGGAKWNHLERRWEYPFTLEAYQSIRANVNPDVSGQLLDYMENERLKREALYSVTEQENVSPDTFSWSGAHLLYGYQRVGVKFLMESKHALLADSMGLGKTVQAIGAIKDMELSYNWKHAPYLVICPNSLKLNWKREIVHWTNGDPVFIVEGTAKKRAQVISEFQKTLKERSAWLIINWEGLRTYYSFRDNSGRITHWNTKPTSIEEPFKSMQWATIIRDEAHRGRHRTAQQTRATFDLAKKGLTKFDLTGTPVYNRPDDLWALLHYLYPKDFTSYWRFVEEYCEVGTDFMGHRIVGPLRANKIADLKARLKPLMLRRTKEEVLKDLPEKLPTQYVYVQLEGKQLKKYQEMRDDMLIWLEEQEQEIAAPVVIAQITRLRQIAGTLECFSDEKDITGMNSAKIDALIDLIDDTEEKIIVFTVYKKMALAIQRRLDKEDITSSMFTGDNSIVERNRMIEEFQATDGSGPRVFISTIKAGGVGITLTAASTVIFTDREWSPSDNEQAEDRAHRIGQTKKVSIIVIMAEDTVDTTHIDPTIKYKNKDIRTILGGIRHD